MATCAEGLGFVICFLKVPLAYSGNMAVAVRPNGTHVALAGPSKQVADPYCIIVIWRDPDPEEATNFLDPFAVPESKN